MPRRQALCGAAASIVLFATARAAAPFQLVTAAEAALPPGKIPTFEIRGSPTRLPRVMMVSPPPGRGAVYSPLDFKLMFRAFGGAAIDPGSVIVTYIKKPDIDMTARIKPFITASGIDITQAEAPPGLHQFWVELMDTAGRPGARAVAFQVIP